MKRTERGFTLVEIMIVVAIIALLAAIAIPNILRGRATANETASVGNMRALLSSMEMYRSVNNAYPSDWTDMSSADPVFYPQPFDVMPDTVQGYNYAYNALTANTYTITSAPASGSSSGGRQFMIDESGRVFHCLSTDSTPAIDTTEASIESPPNAC